MPTARRPPLLLPLLLLSVAIATPTSAAVPVTIGAQGVLRGADGAPVANGVYKLTFALYAKTDDKAAVWSEGPVPVEVKAGVFHHALGALKPLDPGQIATLGGGFLGVQVDADPELPRQPLHAVAYAMTAAAADKLACTGCVTGANLQAASVKSTHVDFAFAGAKVKGGPANAALDLQCTGCVGVKEMLFDGDIDLAGHALKAGKVTVDAVVAKTVSAGSFVGDGSKLTGIQTVSGVCKNKGEVVRGIQPDGTLLCVQAMDPSALPADGLNEISNDQLSNQFVDEVPSPNTPVKIADNNPTGTPDELVFPDVGIAQKLTVKASVTTSDLSQLTLTLFGPDNSKVVLYDKGKVGKALQGEWPEPDKVVSGDLTAWVGKNPKGKWRLLATDHKFLNNKDDGQIKAWSIAIQTLSSKKVAAKGRLVAEKGITLGNADTPCDAAHAGTISWDGKFLQVCNGQKRYPIILGTPGSIDNPAKDCKHVLTEAANAASGEYWLDPDGAGGVGPFKAYCEMKQKGGGWTRVSMFAETYFSNVGVEQREALKWQEVLILEFNHANSPATYSNFVTQQTCYNARKSGFQSFSASGANCDTGVQVRIGGPGGSCGGTDDGCFGVYKGDVKKNWGCNWNCSAGAVTVWGKGYNCNSCRCRNAPYTTTAGCGSGGGKGGWGNLRFHMYVR